MSLLTVVCLLPTLTVDAARPDGSTIDQVATTGGTGVAKFSLSAPGGLYRLTVTDIAKDGYTFDSQHSILEAGKAWF